MSNINPYQPSKPQPPNPLKYQGQMGPKPKNYLVESILLFLCCAGIFAVPAIIFAAQVDSKYNAGDYAGAVRSSDQAKTWCIAGVCIGLFCNTLLFGLTFAMETIDGGGGF